MQRGCKVTDIGYIDSHVEPKRSKKDSPFVYKLISQPCWQHLGTISWLWSLTFCLQNSESQHGRRTYLYPIKIQEQNVACSQDQAVKHSKTEDIFRLFSNHPVLLPVLFWLHQQQINGLLWSHGFGHVELQLIQQLVGLKIIGEMLGDPHIFAKKTSTFYRFLF